MWFDFQLVKQRLLVLTSSFCSHLDHNFLPNPPNWEEHEDKLDYSGLTAEQQLPSPVGEGQMFDGRKAAGHGSAQVTCVAQRPHCQAVQVNWLHHVGQEGPLQAHNAPPVETNGSEPVWRLYSCEDFHRGTAKAWLSRPEQAVALQDHFVLRLTTLNTGRENSTCLLLCLH